MFREFSLAAALVVVGASHALAGDGARPAVSPTPTATTLSASRPADAKSKAVTTKAPKAAASPGSELWYQRFSIGEHGAPVSPLTGSAETGTSAPRLAFDWAPNSGRWGVTLDVDDNHRWSPLATPENKDRVAAGAYFNMSPRIRVGGEMSIETRDSKAAIRGTAPVEPGVKIESAFKF